MQFTVELPDELADQIIPVGCDPSRTALEDMAVEAYRARRLSGHQLGQLLGLDRYQLDGFLKARDVYIDYTPDDLRQEIETGEHLWRIRRSEEGDRNRSFRQ